MNKIRSSLFEAVECSGLKNGMTISVHHHLREGDRVLELILQTIKELKIGDLTLAATSLMRNHDFLVEYLQDGTIRALQTSGLRGQLGEHVGSGVLKDPVIIRSHGGRARALSTGALQVDVAFIAASCVDAWGNANGVEGKSAFGSMGYGMWEARHAKHRVIVSDTLSHQILSHISVPQSDTDSIALIESIGSPEMIQSGSLAPRVDSLSKQIAHHVVQFLLHSGIVLDQTSIQMGSGGISLQVTRYVRTILQKNQWKLKFAIGGITQDWVDMLEGKQVHSLMDVQSFDAACAVSIFRNKNHHEVDANTYANPLNESNLVNSLDIGILSALEIDLDWNVNVLTGSDGRLMGAIGGHQDVAEGAKITIVVAPLIRKRIPILVENVHTLVTRGDHVDVWINDWGVCLKNDDSFWSHRLKKKGVPVYSMEELYHKAIQLVGKPQKPSEIGPSIFVEGRWGGQA